MSKAPPKKPLRQKVAPGPTVDECHKAVKRVRETVIAYDYDGMRRLYVPSRDPLEIPVIFPMSELERLISHSKIVTLKERMAMMEEKKQRAEELQRQSNERKESLQRAQQEQKAAIGTKLSDVQRDAKARNLYMLQRSHELVQEQDNRVKAANRVILATKCRAIRNAQIAEKELIEKQMAEENHRLDMMMEYERQKQIEAENRRKEEEEKKRQRYITELADQMRYNEIERLCQAERVEEDSIMVNKALLALQKEEEQKQIDKRALQQKTRDDLNKANEDMDHYKLIQKEEQRIADLRIQRFMQQKMEREMAREAELAIQKQAKAQEIQRLRDQQKNAQDNKALIEEMNTMRIQEEVEREWRRKEMLKAKKEKDDLDALKQARKEQINDLRKAAARRLERDAQAFAKMAKIQKEEFEKEMEKRAQQRGERCLHRMDLLRQINDKEKERIMQQKERYEESRLQSVEQKRKDVHVQDHIKGKIQQLRGHEIPENYITEIEHHVQGIMNSKK